MSESNKRNFIVHGSILAIAGILVRIIGMLYRIPVVNIIGSEGNGIYGAAFAKPGISALVMGVFTWLSYKGMYTLTSSNVLALVIAFMVALITYFGPYYALTKMRVFE